MAPVLPPPSVAANFNELAELRAYKKKARYVFAKLHQEIELLERVNKGLQEDLTKSQAKVSPPSVAKV